MVSRPGNWWEGGEAPHLQLCKDWKSINNQARIFAMYGRVKHEEGELIRAIPIHDRFPHL
jgi:hypothetical protein